MLVLRLAKVAFGVVGKTMYKLEPLEKPEGQRTLDEVALVKAFKDKNWNEYINSRYDFDDDWPNDYEDCDENI